MDERIQPPWERGKAAQQPAPAKELTTAPRNVWTPGMASPNPKGKPLGTKAKKTLVMEEFEKAGSAVARVVIDAAKAGDMQAATLVLQRLSPPLRPKAAPVEFELDPDASPTEQARQIFAAVSRGQISFEDMKFLLDCLATFVGLQDLESFINERRRVLQGARRTIPGGVLTTS